jgi:FKBP-type peptidyl-prolyl cis-trans isomerase SlyD
MTATITRDTVVTLTYQVKDSDGVMLDDGHEPLEYLHGGYGTLFPRIEEALDGKAIGFSVTVRLQPAEAFGEYDAELLQIEPASSFPANIQVGMQFEGSPDGDEGGSTVYLVTAIEEGKVMLDGNHPLAGVVMDFTCTVSAIRAASADEVKHGHVHSPGHTHH